MTHFSPAVYLTWAALSSALGAFLIFHLWSFDRFKCLKWNHGPDAGAFKRIMTYSYLLSVPLIITYSTGFAIIKYTYGFKSIPAFGIIPTPYFFWSQRAQNAILPLYLSLSFAWALEMVTHLEELCFWLFLVHSQSTQQDWFQSLYFKIWSVGSCLAVVTMPVVTILTRHDVLKCEAITFLTGGLGSFSLTIWFLPVLWTFPSFLASLRQHDVDIQTMVRLTKFHELNCIRIAFRFLFTISIVILGVDGVRPHHDINNKMFPTDLLGIVAAIGCLFSSGLTLIIFFPRSLEGEMVRREQQRVRQGRRGYKSENSASTQTHVDGQLQLYTLHEARSYASITHSKLDTELELEKEGEEAEEMVRDEEREGVRSLSFQVHAQGMGLPEYDVITREHRHEPARHPSTRKSSLDKPSVRTRPEIKDDVGWSGTGSIALQPNRRNQTGDIELGVVLSPSEVELLRAQSKRVNRMSVHNLVHHWRSPIEIGRPSGSTWRWNV